MADQQEHGREISKGHRQTSEVDTQDQAAEPPQRLTIEQARRVLAPFLEANPLSSIGEAGGSENPFTVVQAPWGDHSLVIMLADYDRLIDTLNSVYLPERYTAIYHRDTKDLEVIWTAHPLPPVWEDLRARAFSFSHHGTEYRCEFARSSNQLLAIATFALPVAASTTNHRNLQSFHRWTHETAKAKKDDTESPKPSIGEPMSFWIRQIEWNDDEIFSLASHLNFYMSYYDTSTCTMHVHPPKTESDIIKPKLRYIADKFPERIISREIDENLLHFWMAAHSGDEARQFQYYYRIIEYAAAYFLESDARASIKKILAAPHAWSDVNQITERIWSEFQVTTLDEHQRFQHLIEETVAVAVLWQEMNQNLSTFWSETRFDGGYVAAPLIKNGWQLSDFKPNGLATFSAAIRRIRNALAHGRDQKTGTVIAPTTRNFQLLRPWVSLTAVAAGEVMLYRDLG